MPTRILSPQILQTPPLRHTYPLSLRQIHHQLRSMATAPQTSTLSKDLTLPGHPQTTTPRLVYGTAWKKDRTADLVYLALKSGFRGIDTAAQPRHYQERLVGDGIRRAISDGAIARKELFLQTKFTSISGQDPDDLPYDPSAPLEEQVRASVASSLENLKTPDAEPYLDSVVLHSPLRTIPDTLTVWKTLSSYVPSRIHHLGIANTPPQVLEYLFASPDVTVKPAVVQNRFYGDTEYEVPLRAFCRENGAVFQTFWTLSGNPKLVRGDVVAGLAKAAGVEKEVAYYALVLGLEGTTILDGTSDEEHMKADLEGIEKIGSWAEGEGKEVWPEALGKFKRLIGEE
ncbi:putative aldo-keto reductase [Xylariales sp. AK1849]|nr:putative aldo-keto reductase [Xylariales sp. AK1849]